MTTARSSPTPQQVTKLVQMRLICQVRLQSLALVRLI